MCDYFQGDPPIFFRKVYSVPEGSELTMFLRLLLVGSVLTDLVEQSFVAYVEHARRLLSTPVGFFERA